MHMEIFRGGFPFEPQGLCQEALTLAGVDLQVNGCTTGQKKTWLQLLGPEAVRLFFRF